MEKGYDEVVISYRYKWQRMPHTDMNGEGCHIRVNGGYDAIQESEMAGMMPYREMDWRE
jgi:hypothetical protein